MDESERTSRPDDTVPPGPDSPLPGLRVTLAEWTHHRAPHLSGVSNSNPNATLQRHNLVAITDDVDAGRVIALDFERTTPEGNDTTMLVLGHAVDREATHAADPEGVTTHAARRSIVGGLPGAVVCALLIGLGVWLITGNRAATVGAAVGGAVFGFYVAAVWSFVVGTGQSEAYRQGFIDPDAAEAIIVALHGEDPAVIDRARRAVSAEDRVVLLELDERGQPTRRSRPAQ